MTSLTDAVMALDERKMAVWGGDTAEMLPEDQSRQMVSGFDLDFDEVCDLSALAAARMVHELLAGRIELLPSTRGAWLDGLLTGLMLAGLREREEATT